MGRPGKKSISGGNTALFRLKNGKYIKAKNITGAGIFSNIMKHVNRNKSKLLKIGSSVGAKVLNEAKTQLKKPENRKLLKNVADQLIDKVADTVVKKNTNNASSDGSWVVTSINRRPGYKKKQKRNNKTSGTNGRYKKGSNLQKDVLALTKKEAKKIANRKSRDLVNGFTRYIE